jgi:nucleotide-binding universal stress UspA family protein
MTIVCATHFSDSSLSAVNVAAQLARTHHEPLWLVHVVPHPSGQADVGLDARLSDALAAKAAELSSKGLVVNTAAVFGSLDRAARQVCAAKKASLLVIGDTQHALGPLVVGPLDRFADGVGVPVLVVRDEKPFAAWASGAAPLKVTFALDRTFSSAAACAWIVRLAAYGAIDLVASYLWWPKHADEQDASLVELRFEAEAAFAMLPSNVKLTVKLQEAEPAIGPRLLSLATHHQADVLLLGTHPHRGPVGQQWSVSHEALALAPMSVACVPDGASRLTARRDEDGRGFRVAS